MKSLMPILVYVLLTQTKSSVEADFYDAEHGYCTRLVSQQNTRNVLYYETYTHKIIGIFPTIRIRPNYRIENYTTWRTERRCCFSYEKQGDKCVPICSRLCGNGDCIRPNVCQCWPGYEESSSDAGPLCVPFCKNPCVHGKCTSPNVCTCDKGYSITSLEFFCEPVCSPSCDSKTAFCSDPNTCTCRNGYEKMNGTSCKPTCRMPCTNGICTAPDTCTCNQGYFLDDMLECKPVCDKCVNGTCTAPNVCTCLKGFSLSNEGICMPVCNKICQNGTCVAPDTCMCYEGYEVSGDKNSLHVCKPRCNMVCEPNGECTKPNICTCREGYSLVGDDYDGTIYFGETSVCKPVCKKKCINGVCVKPEHCECSLGYKPSDNEANVCEPICNPSCWPHSTCRKINECTCDFGYKLIEAIDDTTHTCEPICKEACPSNGFCQKPNLCECEEGYLLTSTNGSTFCEPICEINCGNGTCTSPNACTCDMGYVNDENNSCIPFCSIDCGDGTCIEPEICDCEEGYINENQICQPHCQNGCDNGDCVAPNVCLCHTGFFKNGNDTDSICINPCKDSCNKNGICINDQGECDCNYGWTGISCEEPTVCVVFVLEEHQAYERLSFANKSNNSMLLASASYPTCQQCLKEINNETLCYMSLYDEMTKMNDTATCFVNTSSMCYTTSKPMKEVLKIGFAISGLTILIVILMITIACYKFRKGKQQSYLIKESPLCGIRNNKRSSKL